MKETDQLRNRMRQGLPTPPATDSWGPRARQRSNKQRTRSRAVVAVLALAAAGAPIGLLAVDALKPTPTIVANPAPAPTTSAAENPSSDLLVAESHLIEQPDGDVTFCIGGLYQTLPPSCTGVTVKGDFTWESVQHREVNGIRFTETPYRLVGKLEPGDATGTLTVALPPEEAVEAPSVQPPTADDLCSDPMRDANPAMAAPEDKSNLMLLTEKLPVVSTWLSDGDTGVNVLVQGDNEAAFTEMRTVWGGPLCVESSDLATEKERSAVRDRVASQLPADQYLTAAIDAGDPRNPTLEVHVVMLTPALEAQLTEAVGTDVRWTAKPMFTPYVP